MKNLALIALFFATVQSSIGQDCDFSLETVGNICIKAERRLYVVPNVGTIHHIRCRKSSGGDVFVLANNSQSMYGCLLNGTYKFASTKMKIESVGSDFFIVKAVGMNIKYKYDFRFNSWTTLSKKPPGWSTGNREDP